MTINRKIIIPVSVLAAIFFLAYGYLLFDFNRLNLKLAEHFVNVKRNNSLTSKLDKIENEIRNNVLSYRFDKSKTHINTLDENNKKINDIVSAFGKISKTERGNELLDAYTESRANYADAQQEFIKAIESEDIKQIGLSFRKWNLQTKKVQSVLSDLLVFNTKSLGRALLEVKESRGKYITIVVSFMVFTIAAIVLSFIYYRRIITVPIGKLTDFAGTISDGNLTTDFVIDSNDEIGVLSKTFDSMTRKLVEANEGLEKRVSERTEELADTNKSLQLEIVERKKMEESLLESKKLKSLGIITAGIAHEFNNILAVMVGSAELLEDGFKDEKELKKVLHDIIKAGDDGTEIVRNMLKFAKPEGKDASNYIFFDIRHLIDEALDFTAPRWRNMAQAQGIDYKIDKEGMSEIPKAFCNTTEVREVFTNIINNALDAMPDGGSLSFSTWSDDDNVFISISDTGKGMSEDVKRKIFDPFFTTRRPLGTGLGMSVSYSIIMRHGGRIEIESEAGKGATFNLSIPIGKDSIQEAVPLEPARQVTTIKLYILVIDDSDDVCSVMDRALTRDGHMVKTVNNGAEGIELAGKENFDLVLCDLAMPDVYGYDVIKAINKLDKRPKIGIATGWDEKLRSIDDEEFKVDFIIKKPFKQPELAKHINDLFGADGK